MPSTPFTSGEVMGELPQTLRDRKFTEEDLSEGCRTGIYEEISPAEAARVQGEGNMISSSFVVWQEDAEGVENGRFIVNLAKQSKHWGKGSVRMETLPAYALNLRKNDMLMSFDIKAGYCHLRLAPCMRDMFVFRYNGSYYRCIALPFGWGRSSMWFTRLMAPVLQNLRTDLLYRVLCYLDDFLLAPSPEGTTATAYDCDKAREVVESLLSDLGLALHPTKGE